MIPKSLHTVSVLVALARHFHQPNYDPNANHAEDMERALWKAVDVLGYSDSPDVHGLTLQALKKLRK